MKFHIGKFYEKLSPYFNFNLCFYIADGMINDPDLNSSSLSISWLCSAINNLVKVNVICYCRFENC
jgi:hypothetical protein